MAPLRRILSRSQIQRRVRELAAQLRADYSEERPVFVGCLKGAFVFLADLVRQVGVPLQVDFIMVSSYGMGTTSKGEITVLKDVTTNLAGRHVVFVDDIVDSGLTLERVRQHLLARGPGSVHHLGVQTDDLEGLVASMEAKGYRFRGPIKDFGTMKYAMAAAPDDVLLELFETKGL